MTEPPNPGQQPVTPGSNPGPNPGPNPVPPYGYPQPSYGAPPPRRRPSAWWFLPGALSVLLAIAAVVVAIVTAVRMYDTEGYLFADSRSHPFALDSGDHMLFTPDASTVPRCTVTSDAEVPVTSLDADGQETLKVRQIDWRPFARFHSDGGDLAITCAGEAEQVRIGAPAGTTQFVVIGVSIIGALALGVLGIVGLIVVAVLFFTRKPRSVTG